MEVFIKTHLNIYTIQSHKNDQLPISSYRSCGGTDHVNHAKNTIIHSQSLKLGLEMIGILFLSLDQWQRCEHFKPILLLVLLVYTSAYPQIYRASSNKLCKVTFHSSAQLHVTQEDEQGHVCSNMTNVCAVNQCTPPILHIADIQRETYCFVLLFSFVQQWA